MSFINLNPEDFVISTDSITSTLFSDSRTSLSAFFTSSNNKPYLQVYQTASINSNSEVQFSISYGRLDGLGSAPINPSIPGVSPTRITYGQFRTLINGDENTNINFGIGNSDSPDLYVINVERSRYKENLFPGTFNLILSGSSGSIKLSDNSRDVTTLTFCDAGRVFDIVSGSNGQATPNTITSGINNGYTISGSYGKFLPDVGLILLNPQALALPFAAGGLNFVIDTSTNANALINNNNLLFNSLNRGKYFALNSEENITSDYIFVRVKNADFNYTTNPSVINSNGEFYFDTLINNPQTFVTTVGLYNNNNELLAVAKLSKPMSKDFTKEMLLRVKLDF